MSGTRAQAEVNLLLSLVSEKPDFDIIRNPEIRSLIQRSAGRHGMAPLVAYAVRAHVPEEERAWCDRVIAESCASYGRSLRELEFVADLLERRGIRLLALKGPVLAARCYNPPFLRMPSGDLDFGVRECDVAAACAALEQAGYYPKSPLEAARAFSHHVVMLHPTRISLELHFRLTHGPFGLPMDRFFDRAVPFRLSSGTEILTLDRAAEIFHLALHAVCGRFRPFFHLYELRRISKAGGPAMLREAAAMAVESHFVGAFALLDAVFQSCWGEPFLPPDVTLPRTWLHWRMNDSLYRMYGRWATSGGTHTLSSRLLGRWLDLQTTDRPLQALRQIAMLARFASYQLRTASLRTQSWRALSLRRKPQTSKRAGR